MDIDYLLLLQNFREATEGVFNSFFSLMTKFGEEAVLLAIVCLLYWCINKKNGVLSLLSLTFALFINGFLKLTACVYRPWIRDARIVPIDGAMTTATGYSFPSGHSTAAGAYLLSIGYSYKKKKVIAITSVVLVLLVMFSRNYLGVHTPQDVIIGFLTAVFSIFVCSKVLKWADKGENRDWIVLVGIIVLSILYIIYISTKGYPMDYVNNTLIVDPVKMQPDSYKGCGQIIGMLLGWCIERHFIKFNIPKTLSDKFTIFAPGILLVYAINCIVISILKLWLGANWGGLIGGTFLFFFITALYPLIFLHLQERKQQ